MPLHRRLPKRGFNKWRRKDYNEVSLAALQKGIDDGKLAGRAGDRRRIARGRGLLRRPQGRPARARQRRADRQSWRSPSIMPPPAPRPPSRRPAARSTLIENKVLEADEKKRDKTAAKKAKTGKKAAGGADD